MSGDGGSAGAAGTFTLGSRLLTKIDSLNTVTDVGSYRAWPFDVGNVLFLIDARYTG